MGRPGCTQRLTRRPASRHTQRVAPPAIEYNDRYGDGAITPNGCEGPCEGMGWVPVYLSRGDFKRHQLRRRIPSYDTVFPVDDEADPVLIARWEAAEREGPPTHDGYHFVPCPTCQP